MRHRRKSKVQGTMEIAAASPSMSLPPQSSSFPVSLK